MKLLALFAAGLMSVLAAAPVAASQLKPSDAHYVLTRGVLTLGSAQFRLAPQQKSGCWTYEYVAKPTGLARLFIGEVTERSEFCIVEGHVLSNKFEFKRADKSKDNFTLAFNWKDGLVRSSVGELRPLTAGMIDRLAMQIEVQNWVMARGGEPGPEEITVTKVEDDRIKAYRFRIMARETVQTPAGAFETVRVERVDDPKKSTRFWLAPSRDYLAVRVEQTKDGDEQLKMELK